MSEATQATQTATQSLIDIAYFGDVRDAERQLKEGADINVVDEATGLSPLHIAIGRNHLDLVKFLLQHGAIVRSDRQGRWPSTIAELCEVDAEICDVVVDAESAVEGV